MTNRKYFHLINLVILSLFISATTGAETLIFNTSDNPFTPGEKNQGWWSDTANNELVTDNYAVGMKTSGDHNNYFSFDLSSLNLTVLSARLELKKYEYHSSADSETYGLFDVSTDAAILNNMIGPNAQIYNDLGTGLSYGEYVVSAEGSPDDILSFELNSSAVSDINASAGGWFSIGGSLLSIDGSTIGSGTEVIFGTSHIYGEPQRLVLDVIPEPASLTFFSLIGLLVVIKRRK